MELFSVIKNDSPGDTLVWKFSGEDFYTGSELIVGEAEEALFFKDGVVEQVFSGGKFTLSTNNYPVISSFRNFFSGGVSAFSCKIFFVNKGHNLELFWGTDSPIQIRDPIYKLQTSVQARGSYSVQVMDSKKFLLKLLGNKVQSFAQQELNGYFRTAFLQTIKDGIAQTIKESGREILDMCTEKTKVAESLHPLLSEIVDEYGLRLVNFYVSAIDIPENDSSRAKLEEAYANKAVLDVLGQDWARLQSASIIRDLANNEGAGGIAAAGAGLGMGIAAGGLFGELSQQMTSPMMARPEPAAPAPSPSVPASAPTEKECPSCHSGNALNAKFCNECGERLVPETRSCPTCHTILPGTAKFCNECGTRMN
ncbi:SPFH domain-containing protein [Gorillibacterium sp. CAU 1737]|uniref:SPFH domain-containing protein n=1 Tax=Gorillibacterium sp. CAU 1737 TaxID=3140362 RepID=UPI003260BA09